MSRSQSLVPYLLLFPFISLFAVFLSFPIFYTLYLSFFQYQGVSDEPLFTLDFQFATFTLTRMADLEFVGFENYARVFSDPLFYQSMYNTTVMLLIQLPIMIGLALLLALILNSAYVKYSGIFRTALAIPASTNFVAYSVIFLVLVNEEFGLINYILVTLGIGPIAWLTDPFWAKISIVGAFTWRWTGFNMLILFAGLQNIPQSLYEAAELDGCGRYEKFRYVTIPQLRPILLFVNVLTTIALFQLFSEPFVITGGGPRDATLTILLYIYEQGFQNFSLGYASALTYVLVAVLGLISYAQIRLGSDHDA